MQATDRRRFDEARQFEAGAVLRLSLCTRAAPVQQIGATGVRAGLQGLVATAPRGIEGGAVVGLGRLDLALPPAGNAQPVVERAQHVQWQVGHGHGLEQAFDHVPFADRAQLVEQRAGGEQCGRCALVVGRGQIDRTARQFQVDGAAAEHAGQGLFRTMEGSLTQSSITGLRASAL